MTLYNFSVIVPIEVSVRTGMRLHLFNSTCKSLMTIKNNFSTYLNSVVIVNPRLFKCDLKSFVLFFGFILHIYLLRNDIFHFCS